MARRPEQAALRLGESGFESGIGMQASGKFADERLHVGMPVVAKAEGVHFGNGAIGGPVLDGDAVGSDEEAGAVVSKEAMDKNSWRRSFTEELEKLRELRGRRNGETADGNVHKTQTEGFRALAFVIAAVRGVEAEIDDGVYAERFEPRQGRKIRLRTAKELIGDFCGVGNTRKRDFFGERRSGTGNGGRLREGTERKRNERERSEKK